MFKIWRENWKIGKIQKWREFFEKCGETLKLGAKYFEIAGKFS